MNNPVKYKTSLGLLQAAGNEAIDELLNFLLPDIGFGLVTFEGDDFQTGNITYLLYHEIPVYMRVAVKLGESLEHSLCMVASLNCHVCFKQAGKPFLTKNDEDETEEVQILMVISTQMEIDGNGSLNE